MNISTKINPELENLRRQYLQEFHDATTYTNGVRINETLAGRVRSLREIVLQESQFKIAVKSSTSRPVDFKNDIAAWLEAIRAEAKKLATKDMSINILRKVA